VFNFRAAIALGIINYLGMLNLILCNAEIWVMAVQTFTYAHTKLQEVFLVVAIVT